MKSKGNGAGLLPEALRRELAEAGLRVTRQRVAVLSGLRSAENHPSVPELHRRLRRTHGRMSRKTVYSILDQLVRAGLASFVADGSEPIRYEGRRDPHDHARCRSCNRLFDLPRRGRARLGATKAPAGFEVEEIVVTLRGRCARCRRTRSGNGPLIRRTS